MTVLVKLLRKIIQLVQLKYKGVNDCYKNIYVKLTHTFVDMLWIFCVITVYVCVYQGWSWGDLNTGLPNIENTLPSAFSSGNI